MWSWSGAACMSLAFAHAWVREKTGSGGPTTGYSTTVVWTAGHAAADRTWQKHCEEKKSGADLRVS